MNLTAETIGEIVRVVTAGVRTENRRRDYSRLVHRGLGWNAVFVKFPSFAQSARSEMGRLRVITVACALVAWWAGSLACGADTRAAPVEEIAPELYYLQDDAGRLVPVPGFRYRDFVDLMRIKDGLPGQPEPPAAVLETIRVVGTLPQPGAARRCDAVIEMTIRQTRAGWASVPIDLRGLLVTKPARHEGPGQLVLAADVTRRQARDGDERRPIGYRIWLDAPAGAGETRHTVTIEGSLPVEASANHETVGIVLPPATASRVELRTPRVEPAVTVQPAALPPQVAAIEPEGDAAARTSIVVVGGSGPLQIRISDRNAPAEPVNAVPETTVESLVKIDGKTAVIEAIIRIDHMPADAATLRVRLPAKATLQAVRAPATLVERAGTPEAPEAVIRVDRDADGRASVELECQRAVDSSGAAAFEASGFAVADVPAWRQRGRVSLVVDGDWQVEWGDGGAMRRIDPPLAARRPGFVAAFAFDAQPASLPLRVRPRGSRMVIEPEYRYEVTAARVTLDARLRVAVSGAPVSRLVIDIDGWEVEEVGPAGVVDTTGVMLQGKQLVIPFLQGLAGEAVVDIRCGRSVDRRADRVQWRMPAPAAGLVGPAAVVVVADSDIELVPEAAVIRGLVRQVAPAQLRSDADRLVLAYRFDGSDGLFSAQRRFLPRRIDATLNGKVDIDESTVSVTQTIRFTVAHVPLEFIDLLVPDDVGRGGTLEIRQGGQLLNPLPDDETVPVDAGSDADPVVPEASGARRVRALLPVPLLGSGELTVTYELPTPSVPPETTVAEDLPLVAPLDARVGRQTLQIVAADTLAVDVRGDAWKRDAATQGGTSSRSWTSSRLQDIVPLALAARREETARETIVEAAWLQTRLLGDRREDVFRFAVSTAAERLSLALPPTMLDRREGGPDLAPVEVRVDGDLIEGAVRSDGRVSVELPASRGRKAVLVEIRGTRPRGIAGDVPGGRIPGLERVPLEPPEFADGLQYRRFYWEVVSDADEHVLVSPGRWTSQQRWAWGTFGLERSPVVSRDVLDAWVLGNAGRSSEGASLDVASGGHRVVYSGVGPPGSESIWLASTWLVVLLASGPVLAVGLAAVYWPPARSVPAVTGVAAVVTLAATLAPGLAPLVGQAAVPGAVLATVAGLMRALLARPRAASPRSAAAAASSLTQLAPQPSLVVASSMLRGADDVTSSRPPTP